ncbi:phage baseplate assembly protein V [Pseudacidovorax intermedius]|uniref:phage baseplate assembly protein V n=1 Tax=Pseudacidovorax intermedius TaxID=433924 RepID=UPI0026EEEA20|nr:phage baseplate assembly protein V [Pseudacidovorax intermedius]
MNVGNILARLRGMAMRVTLALVDDAPKMQVVQLKGLSNQDREGVERWQQYGFRSVPFAGAEGVAIALGASSDHLAVLVVDDRRFRFEKMDEGEVAVFDDQGQSMHFTREGMVFKGAGLPMRFEDTPSITFAASEKIRFETPRVEATQLMTSMQYTMGGVAGGVGGLVATYNGGSVQYLGTAINLDADATLTHDGVPIDKRHRHPKVQRGDELTDPPTS